MSPTRKIGTEEEDEWRYRDPHCLEAWEVRELREFIEEWRRYKWLWGFIGRVSAWIGGVVAIIWASRDLISKVFKAVSE
jgi:hypothetical protein